MICFSSFSEDFIFLQWDDDSNQFEIAILLLLILWTTVQNLIFCESGDRVTNQFDLFGMEFGQCKWNNLTREMRQMYLIFLLDTQKPKNIQCCGGIPCTRETIKQVCLNTMKFFSSILCTFSLQVSHIRWQPMDTHISWLFANFESRPSHKTTIRNFEEEFEIEA